MAAAGRKCPFVTFGETVGCICSLRLTSGRDGSTNCCRRPCRPGGGSSARSSSARRACGRIAPRWPRFVRASPRGSARPRWQSGSADPCRAFRFSPPARSPTTTPAWYVCLSMRSRMTTIRSLRIIGLTSGSATGLETLALARRGVHVLATDISSRMLNRLSGKAVTQGLESFVQTRNVRAADIAILQDEFEPGSFDGAFSDFGALNCEPDLQSVPEALAYLLRPGAALIMTVWNRLCLAETLAYLVVAKPSRAFARLRDPVPVGRSRFGIPVYARSAGEIVRLFK